MKKILIFVFFSLTLTISWFSHIPKDSFLYIHDEYLSLSKDEAIRSFFIRDPTDLGTSSSINIITSFFDRLYYFCTYSLNVTLRSAQFFLYLIKLSLIIILPYIGFAKLSRLYNIKTSDTALSVVSLWYSFNTFTLIYWNTQAFSLTSLLCYPLAPLVLYFYHAAILQKSTILDKVKISVLLFISSFAFYLSAVLLILLACYSLLSLLLGQAKFKIFFINFIQLCLVYLPLIAVDLIIPLELLSDQIRAVNFVGNETYGLLHGGLLNQLLMWFSWPIYTYWEPRSIFSFSSYFKTVHSLLAPFILYVLVLVSIIKNKISKIGTIFTLLFLLFLFFIKGPQLPFGQIYTYLIKNNYLFNVFRSPDTKFGFGLVLTLSLLLLISSQFYKKIIFTVLVFCVFIIQGLYIFTGEAIIGGTSQSSPDRIISISKPYSELIAFINTNSQPYGYVLTYPPDSFTSFSLDGKNLHIGQDLLSKLSILPFIYFKDNGGLNYLTYQKILASVNSDFPIKYFVFRSDIMPNNTIALNFDFLKNQTPVFSNNLFTVYANPKSSQLISSRNMSYELINPVLYKLNFTDLSANQTLSFRQSFSVNWRLYPASLNTPIYRLLISKSFFSTTHKLENNYANSWTISPLASSSQQTLLLFYLPQVIFIFSATLSFTYLTMLVLILLIAKLKR